MPEQKGAEAKPKYRGCTSDKKSIRHAIEDTASKVDETDAMFMLGACAAFVSYLINKARLNGLLT